MNPCLVIGTAPGWREDVQGAVRMFRRVLDVPWDVCAVNYAGVMHLDPIVHWVSIHGWEFAQWIPERQRRGGNLDFQAHSSSPKIPEGVRFWQTRAQERNGTSGLLATILMERLGYTRVVLAGVHLMGLQTDHVVLEDRPSGYAHHQKAWESKADHLRTYVRSMAGYTSELLGLATPDWVKSGLCD